MRTSEDDASLTCAAQVGLEPRTLRCIAHPCEVLSGGSGLLQHAALGRLAD
jgi:hypothetical protein